MLKTFKEEFAKIKSLQKCSEMKNKIAEAKQLLIGKPLVLYGAGEVGICVAKTLRYYDISITCFCDKNKSGMQEKIGIPIISPQTLRNSYSNANIIICSVNCAEEIKHDLFLLGINPEQIYSSTIFYLQMPEDFEAQLDGYERAYELFADSKSKRVLLERIKCCLIGSTIDFDPYNFQYFDPNLIKLSKEEVFVDGGMYTGDTANIFFKLTENNYVHYYGFEPDNRNFTKARTSLINKKDVTLVEKGLYSCEKHLGFSGSTAASKIDEANGDRFIDVTSIDTYFLDKPHVPTFIKMDIEGAEADALKGSKNIIEKYKPKLAICAYHKLDDVYVLPELIKSFRNDYIFYLRQYSDYFYDTVLYAL